MSRLLRGIPRAKRLKHATHNKILNQAHPSKSIKVLQQACSELDYERAELGLPDVGRIVAGRAGSF